MKATASERRWPLETEEASKQPPERNTALHPEVSPVGPMADFGLTEP